MSGFELGPVPAAALIDPESFVLANPQVAEHRRFCSMCDEPVGRSRDGQPGRTSGFCRKCGTSFSFEPKLQAGDVVSDQYEIVGCLAHGGLGWIYLARVRKVAELYVVLKGLINTADEHAAAAAVAERRFLAEVEHPNIVRIHNFVEHDGDGYIVMEFVRGISLRGMLEARRTDEVASPFPVEEAIAYCLEILPALGHLHELGLAFCDFKPDNVMRTKHSLKLIDLGGVFRIGDTSSTIFGTPGFQAPEVARTGPTIASDLYTVARTLAVLSTDFVGYQGAHLHSLPAQEHVPLFVQFESLYRFLERATAPDPGDRFQTAAEMAAQLSGVRREVVAAQTGVAVLGISSCFTPEAKGAVDRPNAGVLPSPIVDPEDPYAGLILSLSSAAPDQVIKSAEGTIETSIELELWKVRALVALANGAQALAILDAIDRGDAHEWRTSWYRGVLALTAGQHCEARGHFDRVHRWLPGELAPKLGLAMAAELDGDHGAAAKWYEIVTTTDPSFRSAAFGLARCRVELGDIAGAIVAYDRVPHSSSTYVQARLSVVELLLASERATTIDDVVLAADIVDSLSLDAAQRTRWSAEVLERALALTIDNAAAPIASVFGQPLTERGLRLELERTYRWLARRTAANGERVALVDRANQVRPRSLL